MESLRQEKIEELLSAYVDGELSPTEHAEVERLLHERPELEARVWELRRMKELLAQKKPLPEQLGFWTRLSAELDRREREEENLLPFPRKFLPYVSCAGIVLVVAIGFLVLEERESVMEYVNQQAEQVQKAVGENFLGTSILPLFSNIDKNQVLQFALFGTLPLDAKAETALRVDEEAEKGFRIDVGKTAKQPVPSVTVNELFREIKPTPTQARVIDSLLDISKEKIESSVFIAEDKGMAIDPELPKFNRVILTSIAAALEPSQRSHFERFLRVHNAPYKIAATHAMPPEEPEKIFRELRRAPRAERFIVVTPDTFVFTQLALDVEQVSHATHQLHERQRDVHTKVEVLIRKFAEREEELRTEMRLRMKNDRVRVFGAPEFFSIQIEQEGESLARTPRVMMVQPRAPEPSVHVRQLPRTRSFNYRFYRNDSATSFELEVDSMMMHFLENPVPDPRRVRAFEQRLLEQRVRKGLMPDSMQINNVMQLFHTGKISFDSLMKVIYGKELQEVTGMRKSRVRVQEQ